MPRPLDGIRVINLTSMVSGPLCTALLGDQGADVVKIENPAGDHTRAGSNRRGGMAASFLHNNRNKRSVALDLKTEAGRAAVLRIAAGADVFAPTDPRGRAALAEWLFWQVGKLGPMAGRLSHYVNYAQGERYAGEYQRCFQVLEDRLRDRDFTLGDYSIAAMAAWP